MLKIVCVIILARDIFSENILLDKKVYENILIYEIWYITFMGSNFYGSSSIK